MINHSVLTLVIFVTAAVFNDLLLRSRKLMDEVGQFLAVVESFVLADGEIGDNTLVSIIQRSVLHRGDLDRTGDTEDRTAGRCTRTDDAASPAAGTANQCDVWMILHSTRNKIAAGE